MSLKQSQTGNKLSTVVCSTPKYQKKWSNLSLFNQTATGWTAPSLYCNAASSAALRTTRWSLLGSGQICVWSVIIQPDLKGQTSSRGFPTSTWIHPTQNQEHSFWRPSTAGLGVHWRLRQRACCLCSENTCTKTSTTTSWRDVREENNSENEMILEWGHAAL